MGGAELLLLLHHHCRGLEADAPRVRHLDAPPSRQHDPLYGPMVPGYYEHFWYRLDVCHLLRDHPGDHDPLQHHLVLHWPLRGEDRREKSWRRPPGGRGGWKRNRLECFSKNSNLASWRRRSATLPREQNSSALH